MGALEDYVNRQRIQDRTDPMLCSVMSRPATPDPMASPEYDAVESVAPEAWLGLLGGLGRVALSRLAPKVSRELPAGFSIKEFGASPADREAIDELLKPWLAARSPVHPDDRDIFMSMRNTYRINPNARTRFLLDETQTPRGAYQIANRGEESYLPNVGVTEQGKGYGRALLNHAVSTRENPSFLVSAPGKETFYRKLGLMEKADDGISSFHFRQGGLIQMKGYHCG